ncbi:hypothetical protein BX616_000787 [Lobosporangium transversale]|uniref:Glycosyltransferase family 17-domain-containing protein n=1 Tax=Lobosporangium transversale TaxID=64571 RepID=A0A1Y2GSL9_9FUNG|nr:glycosyltransferase family 17-domain-containing protein [Lobosporangium transversale]KAF9906204.1 hypothetical protein BX616_000787 [Lobosporangium transversale]ORZ19102.1 glycosyltransferase family 17-domain-containing protein [Lobosporangium transversale]|eukprot:XP_021882270.1 glycosyltransferase family 17-domain-containing protein [Lobosporangium transversale]
MTINSVLPFTSEAVSNHGGLYSKIPWSRRSLSYPIKLGLGLVVFIMMMLIVQERYQTSLSSSSKSHKDVSIPTPHTTQPISTTRFPRVFDIILLNSELELLDIRLNELYDVVDYFVIIESPITFSGITKPLHYYENQERFKVFRKKIIHVVIPTSDFADKPRGWEIERATRNIGFWRALDIHRPVEGDFLVLSDLDEIPRSSVITAMKLQDPQSNLGTIFGDGTPGSGGDIFRFGCQFYYYSYEFRHIHGQWNGPVIVRYRESDSPRLDRQASEKQRLAMHDLSRDDWRNAGERLRGFRNLDEATYISDACHHCSWCFPNITQVITKVESYSHSEHNQPKYKERQWILERYSQGLDLFERDWDRFEYVANNKDLPKFILDNPKRFEYMTSRKGKANAGFVDVDPLNP